MPIIAVDSFLQCARRVQWHSACTFFTSTVEEIIMHLKSAGATELDAVGNAPSLHSSDRSPSTSEHITSDGEVNGGFMQRGGASPAYGQVSPSDGGHTLRLALLLAFPAIGLEQLLHTDRQALVAMPLHQVLHWLSDSLLALPMAAVAVWGGQRLATRLGLGASTPSDMVGRACLIALLFALVLVPGAALHDLADRLTHVHASFSTHAHVPRPPQSAGSAAVVARFVGHALSDGFLGQAVGLPVLILALMWGGRTQRPSGATAPQRKET